MGEYFVELDKKFTNEYRGSAVDVDIFANNVKTDSQVFFFSSFFLSVADQFHYVNN